MKIGHKFFIFTYKRLPWQKIILFVSQWSVLKIYFTSFVKSVSSATDNIWSVATEFRTKLVISVHTVRNKCRTKFVCVSSEIWRYKIFTYICSYYILNHTKVMRSYDKSYYIILWQYDICYIFFLLIPFHAQI
jgi:hypothetical protein